MKIGILSDTHGNIELLRRAAKILKATFAVDRFLHLGDNEGDEKELASFDLPLTSVPGIYDKCYPRKGPECAHVERIGEFSLVALHDLHDLGRLRGRDFDIVCHGHTHNHSLAINIGKLFLNPGHLKSEMDRGAAATFAILEIKGNIAQGMIINLDGDVVETLGFRKTNETVF